MIGVTFDASDIQRTREANERESTFIGVFAVIDLIPIQRQYFLQDGVDGGRRLAAQTIKRRSKRSGYYKRPARFGANAAGPYGVWTGNTMQHTTQERGEVRIRSFNFTLSHGLERRITEYWAVQRIVTYIENIMNLRFQTVFTTGRTLPFTQGASWRAAS